MPEKIYLSYETDNGEYKNHIFIDYMWHRHPFEGKKLKNVEYMRTDVLIEKTCEFLKSYRQDTPDGTGYIGGIINDKTIEDFKTYMKGE